jgi:hypothetical protein
MRSLEATLELQSAQSIIDQLRQEGDLTGQPAAGHLAFVESRLSADPSVWLTSVQQLHQGE